MVDDDAESAVKGVDWSDVMNNSQLVSWHGLSIEQLPRVFPDATVIGDMSVEFESTEMTIYRFRDAAGNFAFAFHKGAGLVSHGSQILSNDTISNLRQRGAKVS